ncbi:MAG: response regulator transcription factor [Acidobacteria bacterium]|nr:MAG: response regulator transcription factor [Acidobacteriota bacterium]
MADTAQSVRIVIADDHPIFRDGLRKLLEAEQDFKVIGEASDGGEAIEMAQQLKPDVLLLDLAMPRVPGLEALRQLGSSVESIKVILLTAAIEREQIVDALHHGVRGVVLKESATELLLKSIRCVVDGQYWVGRESVSDLVRIIRDLTAIPEQGTRKRSYNLTPRELDIIAAIVDGYTNKDIADKFSIAEQTVKHHLGNIFDKLGVSNRLELALFAVNHHLVEEH